MLIKRALVTGATLILLLGSLSASAGWLDELSSLFGGADKATEEKSTTSSSQPITANDISQAFRQALEIGSQKVVDQLGRQDGFNGDSLIRILLPEELQTVKKWLGKVGLDGTLDDLEVSLNRAAESAVPKAKDLFLNTINDMTFEDVKSIYSGGNDAATRYFQQKMTPALTSEMKPLVQQSLSDVGAVKLYDKVIGDYESIPFVPDVKANLTDHVIEGGLNGIFHYLAKEEVAIRQDPVKRTTELLKRVFSQ